MHPIIRRIQTNTEGVHLPHIKLVRSNVVGCAVLQLNVIWGFFVVVFSSFQQMKLSFVIYWVCVLMMAVESTVETVKDRLELRLAQ